MKTENKLFILNITDIKVECPPLEGVGGGFLT